MGGTGNVRHRLVILRTLVLVWNEQANRSAQCFPVFDAGQDGHGVGFLARCRQFILARPPAIQLRLEIRFREFQLRRAAIHDRADSFAVRFTECADFE